MSMEDLSKRIRPELARSSPYRWQEGIPDRPVDRFDMNTPAEGPAWYTQAIARLAAIPPNDYPDASYLPLKRAIAGYVDLDPRQVVVGAGCDEVLALCAQLALGRGDTALVAKPTYQLYTVASRNAGAEVLALEPGDDLALAREELVTKAADVRLVWLCSPNNPTGEELDAALVERICAACPGIVVLDQAYLELGGEDFAPLIAGNANLVVTRTFSKGFGLGAARVGYGLAQPALAEALDALRPPGSISSWSAAVAELACREADEMRERCAAIVEARGGLAAGMRTAGVDVLAQAGNFILARSPVPDVFEQLAERRCVVRTFAHEPLLADCFRVTVSHRDANARLLRALAELAGGDAPVAEDGVRGERIAEVLRATRETSIEVRIGLLGGGHARVTTGLGFLDHMLTSLAFWSLTDIELHCPRRPLGRRAPHGRGLRARARRGVRHRARRPLGRAPLRLLPRAARRGARRGDGRPLRPRHRPARPRAQRAGDRADAVVADPPLLRQLRAPRAARTARERARPRHPPRGGGRVQGAGAGAARGGRARPRPQRHREHQGRSVIATFVDYGAGNLRSLRAAFERTGAEVAVTDRPEDVAAAAFVVIPGVGQAASAMEGLRDRGLVDAILGAVRGGAHLFGVCIGMQLLFTRSEEGDTAGLGLLPGTATRLEGSRRLPHMGWNDVEPVNGHPLTAAFPAPCYFAHSYAVQDAAPALRARLDPGRAGRLREPRRRGPRGRRAVPPGALGRGRRGVPARRREVGRRCCVSASSRASTCPAGGSSRASTS